MRAHLVDRGAMVLALVTLEATLGIGFPLFWALAVTLGPPRGGGGPLDGLAMYGRLLVETDIGRWYLNSIITSGGVTLGVLAISATCGYAISQLEFTGRKLLWGVILASFLIPVQALIVNHFLLMNSWKLINTLLGVILPQLIAPIAVIVYKQFFDAVPKEFREAAEIDGAGHWRVLWSVYLPLNWGATAALGIVVFIGAWNAFLWPFLAITKEPLMNITVATGEAQRLFGTSGLATALLAGLPVAIVYLLFQGRITRAITMSAGIKG